MERQGLNKKAEKGNKMKLLIQDWKDGLIDGVDVQMINEVRPTGDYFDWRPSDIVTKFATNEISGGLVEGRFKPIEYDEVEYHIDAEVFYFVSGEGVMLFCDLREGEAVPESYVMLRVKAGMQISVSPGKAHFVPISTNRSEPVKAAVVSPKMEALMVPLKERAEA